MLGGNGRSGGRGNCSLDVMYERIKETLSPQDYWKSNSTQNLKPKA